MRRRLLRIFAALLAVVLLLVVTVPWWLGNVASAVGRSRGLTIGSYERVGYSRFVLKDVEYRRENVRVTVSRAEADTPLLWLWRHSRNAPTHIVAERWMVDVTRRANPPPSKTEPGWVPLRGLLQRIATQLDRWLPTASTGAGVVRWPTGEITAASAKWAKRELAVEDLAFRALKVSGTAAFPSGDDVIRVALRTAEEGNRTSLESRGAAISGEIVWWDQRATLSANFAPRGWVPPQASLQADAITLPGARLRLGELYTQVRGRARADWSETHFVADIAATADPVEGKKAPPLELALRGQGDAQAFTLQALNATLPGITARLSEPVTVERSGKIRESAARFAVQADLAQQPWFEAKGTISGEARVASGISASTAVEFQLQAHEVVAQGVAVSQMAANGQFAWPRIEIASGQLVGGEGERFTLHGAWDFRAKELSGAVVDGTIRRASLARWLPAQPEFDVITLHAEAAGALAEIGHSGRAQLESVKFRGVNAAALAAEWKGKGAALESFSARASTGATTLTVGGALDRTGLTMRALELARQNTPLLTLQAPAVVRWQPALRVETLRLAGPEGSLTAAITWGETGQIEVAARNIASTWFADLLAAPPAAWKLDLLAITGSWERGPMTYSVTAGASVELGEGRAATANIAARGSKDGLVVEALRATESNATVVNATGRVPVVLHPGTARLVEMQPDGALRLDATVAPNATFWEKLAATTGVELIAPDAALRISGTWQRPEGEIRLKATKLAVDPKRVTRAIPTIEGLDVQVTGDREGVNLQTFVVSIEGQPVRARGRVPVPDGDWSAAIKEPLVLVQRGADMHLEVPDADVAVFARFLPAFLAPKGRLQIDLGYKAGGFDGFLKLRDAASRPLGPLGVLQEINADLTLAGRKLELRGVTAKSGGQPITLTGTVELPAEFIGAAALPGVDVVLRGENLPFVRQTGLLVRGDLDLKLQSAPDGAGNLSGTVNLRDSLFLQDIRAFLPRAGGGGARRPPYFEVTTPPLDRWTISLNVTGDRFLRLRTPVFSGVASANFRLRGTLGEPRAIGEVTLEEGAIRMPFATLEVQQGSVRLTEANPYEPTIYVRATGRRFGYDLAMEVDGEGAQPNVTFTSSPALDSEQVLLMVMTGAVPSNDITVPGAKNVASIGIFLSQTLLGSLTGDASDADRWTLATGEKISRTGEETLDFEYKISDRWRVLAEKNEFDEFNAGIKWRIFPRQTEREKEKSEAKHAKK